MDLPVSDRRLRIVLFHNTSDLYGASRMMWRFAKALQAHKHAVFIILPEEGPLSHRLQDDGLKTMIQPSLRSFHRKEFTWKRILPFFLGLPFSILQSARHLQKIQADMAYSNTATVLSACFAALFTRTPHVWQIREVFDQFETLWKFYKRWIVRCSRKVTCVSQAVACQFSGISGAAEKVVVVCDGFPPKEFEPPAHLKVSDWNEARRRWRAEHHVDEEVCLIGTLGWINLNRKGQGVLVEAAKLLVEKGIKREDEKSRMIREENKRGTDSRFFKVVIVGGAFAGNEHHELKLKALIQDLQLQNQMILTGEIEDVMPIYAALDLVVSSSVRPEAFGGIVIEAMAMWKPVVGTAIGGTLEQIEDGVTGFLVPPNDPSAMAEALGKLIADPELRRRMGEAGRKRYEERFAFDKMYEKLLKCFQEAASGRP